MADTFTSKLGLRQYDASLNYDVSKFSADNLLIDNAFGTVICTSGTRPSTGLFNGMTLWETDTRRFVVRVAGVWTPVPNVCTIADAAARTAITAPYDGMVIYRQDTDWLEIYDGAAWRVPNGARTTSLALITNPVSQQNAILTTDSIEYRWDGVSTWNAIRYCGPAPCIERRHNASTQPTGAGSAYKVLFDTSLTAGVDITYASGNFTFARSGRYLFTTSLRLSAVSELYIWFARSGVNNDNQAKDSKPAGTGLNKGTSGVVRVTAAQDWSVFVWSSLNIDIIRESANANDYPPYFSAHYLGPL